MRVTPPIPRPAKIAILEKDDLVLFTLEIILINMAGSAMLPSHMEILAANMGPPRQRARELRKVC